LHPDFINSQTLNPKPWNWSHKPPITEMWRVRPAIEAGLMQSAEATALYMRPVLNSANDSSEPTSESMIGANTSFAPANASFARATLLPCYQSTGPVAGTNDLFKCVRESRALGYEVTPSVSDKRGHRSTAPRNSYKTSQLQFFREKFSRNVAQPAISTGFTITMSSEVL
jgi:hypothetical protein